MADPGTPATDYKADQIDILYDLIEASNPGFKTVYPKGTVQFGAPAVISVQPGDPYKNDTSILISAAPGSSVLGQQTVKYRRIDLGTIYRNMKLTLNDYFATTQLPVATWKASFAQKFGIKIPASDIANTAALSSGVATTVSVVTTSQCYKGSVQLTWTVGPRPFNMLITDSNRALAGRLYPGGNDFTTPGRKPQGEFIVYAQDASAISAILQTIPPVWNPTVGANSGLQQILDWLNVNTAYNNWQIADAATPGGCVNITWYRYSLPAAALPEANVAKYNTAVVIQAAANSWFAGKVILQYKV